MTPRPSTTKAGFVSAVLDAGYHIKLAGGGRYNTAAVLITGVLYFKFSIFYGFILMLLNFI